MRNTVVILLAGALSLAGAGASSAAEPQPPEAAPGHAWKLISVDSVEAVHFIDTKTIKAAGAGQQVRYWELAVYGDHYVLNEWAADCAHRTTALHSTTDYRDGQAKATSGRPTPMAISPESIGEDEWLFVCGKTTKYAQRPTVGSIEAARAGARHITDYAWLSGLFTDAELHDVGAQLFDAFKSGGHAGLSDYVRACYDQIGAAADVASRKLAARCLASDIVAAHVESALREGLANTPGGQFEPDAYLGQGPFAERVAKYAAFVAPDPNTLELDTLFKFAEAAQTAFLGLVHGDKPEAHP